MQVDKLKDNKHLDYQKPNLEIRDFCYDDVIATSLCGRDECTGADLCSRVGCTGCDQGNELFDLF